ncbi:unnamed protein product [Prorocentrum cordatum]|uniref:Uncharacterized protein n=1 Tax=Prorocentrum cordatum TaxID=2364126 RepID=A0ABN9PGN8_9DINO|nr:unnamed protein product [Polarella glacialis]
MHELEACAEVDPLLWRGVDAAVLAVKRDCGTREANAILDEAKAASEVVAEANAILRLVPKEWAGGVSSYELAVLLGAGGLPEVCVAARRGGGGRGASAGIWEVERFKSDRLDHMREAADLIASGAKQGPVRSGGGKGVAAGGGDWEAHAWSEVPLDDFRTIARRLQEQRERCDEQERARGGTMWDSFFSWGLKDSRGADSAPWLGGHLWGGASFWDLLAEPHRLLAGSPPRGAAAVLDQPAPLPAAAPPAESSAQRASSRRPAPARPAPEPQEAERQGRAGGGVAAGPCAEPRSPSHHSGAPPWAPRPAAAGARVRAGPPPRRSSSHRLGHRRRWRPGTGSWRRLCKQPALHRRRRGRRVLVGVLPVPKGAHVRRGGGDPRRGALQGPPRRPAQDGGPGRVWLRRPRGEGDRMAGGRRGDRGERKQGQQQGRLPLGARGGA